MLLSSLLRFVKSREEGEGPDALMEEAVSVSLH